MEPTITSTELAVPGIGQLVNLEDPREVAIAIDGIRDLEWMLKTAKQDLTRALVYASQQDGSKTLHMEGVTAVIKGGTQTQYDPEPIRAGLLAAGMSEERVAEVVVETTTYRVSAKEAKRVAGANPAYKKVIDENTVEVEVPHSVSVSLKGKS